MITLEWIIQSDDIESIDELAGILANGVVVEGESPVLCWAGQKSFKVMEK